MLASDSGLLEAAHARHSAAGVVTRTILGGLIRDDERLVYVVQAGSAATVQRLLVVALLPAGRIREIRLDGRAGLLPRRHPGGDPDPRVEAELVEDVVDVGLDGAL